MCTCAFRFEGRGDEVRSAVSCLFLRFPDNACVQHCVIEAPLDSIDDPGPRLAKG